MNALAASFKDRVSALGLFVGTIWLVSVANFILPLRLAQYGLQPRSVSGLAGFVTAPWIHAGWGHLLSNTPPLLVLGWLAMWPQQKNFWHAVAGAMLGAGALTWLIGGSHTVHIGASGVVFGLGSFIVARGYYSRRILDALIALPAMALYGLSLLLGVLPSYPGVSWEGHLGGAIGGVLAAKLFCSAEGREA